MQLEVSWNGSVCIWEQGEMITAGEDDYSPESWLNFPLYRPSAKRWKKYSTAQHIK